MEGAQHVARIKVLCRSVNRDGVLTLPAASFLNHKKSSCISLLASAAHAVNSRLWGQVYESTITSSGNDAVGCFFFKAAGGKFSGCIPRRPGIERRRDAVD